MKRRATLVKVTDHAVLRYLEREHGLDVAAVRAHLAGRARNGAELGAIAVQVEHVKLVLSSNVEGETTVVTCLTRAWSGIRSGDER